MRVSLASVLLLPLCALPARASAPGDVATQKDKAKRLLDEGAGLYDAGDISGAYARFSAAYDAYPSPKILLNIGTALKRLGRVAEAAQAYDRFLSEAAAQTDVGDDKVSAARAAIADLLPRVGRIRLEVAPPEATVSVDDRVVGPANKLRILYVAPGERRISATAPEFVAAAETITAAAGREDGVRLTLTGVNRPAPTVEAPPRKRFFTWIAAGAAVACGGAGTVFGLQARSQFQDLKAVSAVGATPDQGRYDATKKSLDRSTLLANVFFATAGAAAVTTVILFLTEGRTDAEPAPAPVSLAPLPGGLGLAAQGRF